MIAEWGLLASPCMCKQKMATSLCSAPHTQSRCHHTLILFSAVLGRLLVLGPLSAPLTVRHTLFFLHFLPSSSRLSRRSLAALSDFSFYSHLEGLSTYHDLNPLASLPRPILRQTKSNISLPCYDLEKYYRIVRRTIKQSDLIRFRSDSERHVIVDTTRL